MLEMLERGIRVLISVEGGPHLAESQGRMFGGTYKTLPCVYIREEGSESETFIVFYI